MNKTRTTTGAEVQLTIQMSNLGSWGSDCPLSQVYDQALEAAIGRLGRAFKDIGDIKVVGIPNVKAIITDMDKRP